MTAPFIQTYTRKKFYLLDPRPEDICIKDIAYALAHQNRFNGHTHPPYNVAQHSVFVSRNVGPDTETQLAGLMHDAAEAYIGDMVRPLKQLFPDFSAIEARIQSTICSALNIPEGDIKAIRKADELALATEFHYYMGGPVADVHLEQEPRLLGAWLQNSRQSYESFLSAYHALQGALT